MAVAGAGPALAAVLLVPDCATDVEEGLEHLLEVWQAARVVEVWPQWRDGRQPTPGQATHAVFHSSTHDAFLPAEELESDA